MAAITAALFVLDWLTYALAENRPSYYRFSTYVEYRDALTGLAWIAAGLGYALLAGSLAGAAVIGGRRRAQGRAAVLGLGAATAALLPLVVPAVLPRAEYGKDPALHVADVYERPPALCMTYSTRPPTDPLDGRGHPGLCVELRAGHAAWAEGGAYTVAEHLNDSGVEPFEEVEAMKVDGLEIVNARWSRPGAPRVVPRPAPARPVPEDVRLGERRTKRNVLRVARQMRRCGRTTGRYNGCVDPAVAQRLGVTVAARADAFSVGATSARINNYSVDRPPGGPERRTCIRRGVAGCPPSGYW